MTSAAVRTGEGLTRIDPLEGSKWNEIIGRHPYATIFHTSEWARVLHDTYGYTPYYFADDTSPRPAVACLAHVDSWITGRRGISLPFTDRCSFLENERFGFQELFQHGVKLGDGLGWRYLEIRGTPSDAKYPPSLEFYEHTLDLRPNIEELWKNLDGSVRRAIRKAERSNVKVTSETGVDAVREYYRLHCLTRRKHGLPPQPYRFFENIHRHIIQRGLGFTVLGKVDEQAVAGAIFFSYQGLCLYKFGASNSRFDRLRPSNLVMWTGIARCKELGSDFLDFGRTSVSAEGLRRYKTNFGSLETRLSYLKWQTVTSQFLSDRDRASGWQNRVFEVCPVTLNRIAGSMVYGHIA